ncbi:hypothetical protein CUMW_178090 [Citrus unshiu]|uniref:Serine-threonine/tyrosine-protein kinase catalytic domain-containing protein n=1 Tax=Citrus unshiu TaxID=55188 RepID=A0A2H5PY40_CITUN|nr:hypothetical protein CUMW_178090 [Citrus unshiu]
MLMLKSTRPWTDQILSPTFTLSTVARTTETCVYQKRIRDAGGFAGVNPPMPKLAQDVYGKTVQFGFKNEYGLGSGVSTNGDVYSYGILLLEMVTTKKPTDVMFEGDLNLHRFTRMALPDHVMDIVDPILLNDESYSYESQGNKVENFIKWKEVKFDLRQGKHGCRRE